MLNILEKIILNKKREVLSRKETKSTKELESSPYFSSVCFSLKKFLCDPQKTNIIAEYKRRSPSKGIINDKISVEKVVQGYEQAGASAISVLTDSDFFEGRDEDLIKSRAVCSLPILRKDFVIDEYQIIEAKSLGADVVLLIAACLSPGEVKKLAQLARSLSMEVLLEVHSKEELENNMIDEVDCIGVNNRNLKDFSVNINISLSLASYIPDQYVKISESGIEKPESIIQLKNVGYKGFLIGENFMKHPDPGQSMREFVNQLKT